MPRPAAVRPRVPLRPGPPRHIGSRAWSRDGTPPGAEADHQELRRLHLLPASHRPALANAEVAYRRRLTGALRPRRRLRGDRDGRDDSASALCRRGRGEEGAAHDFRGSAGRAPLRSVQEEEGGPGLRQPLPRGHRLLRPAVPCRPRRPVRGGGGGLRERWGGARLRRRRPRPPRGARGAAEGSRGPLPPPRWHRAARSHPGPAGRQRGEDGRDPRQLQEVRALGAHTARGHPHRHGRCAPGGVLREPEGFNQRCAGTLRHRELLAESVRRGHPRLRHRCEDRCPDCGEHVH
mmetsp:Transcript_57114/g.162726  ORF Transcript_57114/g.162726 Transcript_57114/m.162726 type:complete len:292 (-) Transcript_57114:1342-2217(-)